MFVYKFLLLLLTFFFYYLRQEQEKYFEIYVNLILEFIHIEFVEIKLKC